jgi:acyl-CoA synthetase (AMP-forming)/AMP-acid ligase II
MHPEVIAAAHPDRPAVITEDGVTLTYAQLARSVWQIARLFRDLGRAPGDHVALCMANSAEMLAVLWGAHSAGLFYTACSTRLTAGELAYIVDDCDASVIVRLGRLGRPRAGDHRPDAEGQGAVLRGR